jgi:hypothetical protein
MVGNPGNIIGRERRVHRLAAIAALAAVDDRERLLMESSGGPIHGPFVLHLQAAEKLEVPGVVPLGVLLPVVDDGVHFHVATDPVP